MRTATEIVLIENRDPGRRPGFARHCHQAPDLHPARRRRRRSGFRAVSGRETSRVNEGCKNLPDRKRPGYRPPRKQNLMMTDAERREKARLRSVERSFGRAE